MTRRSRASPAALLSLMTFRLFPLMTVWMASTIALLPAPV